MHANKIFENVKKAWFNDHKLCRIATDARVKNARDVNHALHVWECCIATAATLDDER